MRAGLRRQVSDHHQPFKSMDTKHRLYSETLASTWTFSGTHGALDQKLVVAGDRLIGVAGSTIFAVDMYTGRYVGGQDGTARHKWPITMEHGTGDPQVTAADGTVYFMNGGKLTAVRLADAAPVPDWQAPALHQVVHLFARNGRLIAVHLDEHNGGTVVSGFETVSGRRVFDSLPISRQRPGRVTYGDDAIFFVASGKLNAVNVDFGDRRWQVSVQGDTLGPTATPLVAGRVVVVAGASQLHGIDAVTGAKKWSIPATGGGRTTWSAPATHIPVPAVAATRAASRRAALPTDALPNPGAAAAAVSAAGLVVAANGAGDLVAASLLDGRVLWRTGVSSPGAPIIIENTVFVTTNNGTRLARYDLLTGASRGTPYVLPVPVTGQLSSIANGAVYLVNDIGNISEHPFTTQHAAYFDGRGSLIDIRADESQFDFGIEDFTVEAWIRGSGGGEIVSSYPTRDPDGHGFRLNVTPDGRIGVAITNGNGSAAARGRTRRTNAADGEWHHIALIRREGTFAVLLDGLSLEVLLPAAEAEIVAVGGGCALTIGAYVSTKNGRSAEHFRGLIREVRIWDRALDIETVVANLTVALTGREPRLRGLWPLDDIQKPGAARQPRNAVTRHRAVAEFVGAASRPTDLIMDGSAFPYLLHESAQQWPYAGSWAARGRNPVTGPAAASADGIVAFAADNVVYAVCGHDGKRVWSMESGTVVSNPVADGNGFVVMTEDESPLRLDSRTGGKTQLKGFDKLPVERNAPVIDPAVTDKYVAAATASGTVMIVNRVDDSAKSVKIAGPVVRLSLDGVGLLVLSGSSSARKLTLIDPATAGRRGSAAMQSDVFCTADNWIFCVRDRTVIRLDSNNLSPDAVQAASADISGRITGMLASPDDDLLVVATDGGTVRGLTLGLLSRKWETVLPVGAAGGSNAVNSPALDGDGRIVCTTASGTIAVLDPVSGALNGLYGAKRGAVGKPAFASGTLYTGCEDAPAGDSKADLDGALHSVVFGETMALRLNLDEQGRAVPGGGQHAVIDVGTDGCTLHLMDVRESCVEAWVNIPSIPGAGGGILGICPAETADFDINLWVESDGTLHFTSRTGADNIWSGLHALASTGIIDGKWHHIAVSRLRPSAAAPAGSPDRVIFYIDGQAVDTASGPAPASPGKMESRLKAFVGATASDTCEASRPFVGMIAEVRVWDTYMAPSEIVSRMHVKLRGDEPDLLAYWNFDYEAVHDCARQGHDGRVERKGKTVPNWWLVDLPFTQPAYPFVATAAKITAEGAGRQTTYSLTVKVCRADGSGMADQDVRLWYVKYGGNDPASITVNATSLAGIAASAGGSAAGSAQSFVGKTMSDGTVKFTIVTPASGHGPALDLWTAFMPFNERFHVNVLIDNQQLAKPAPPTLTAQAKLIQDYHYTTGNRIDGSRDRSTWRVILRAADANDTACGREPVSIWSDSATTIEAGGKSYPVNPHNAVNLATEANGELTLVMAADGLVAPTLYARAGFMHRNDRIVINPDRDTHAALSEMKPEELTRKRVANWNKDSGTTEGESLLSDEQGEHAPKIAEAVRHVSRSVTPSESDRSLLRSGRPSRARMKLMEMRAAAHGTDGLLRNKEVSPDALLLDEMKQPQAAPADDRIALMRTMAGTPREVPIDPEGFRDSLKGNLGFVFEKEGNGVRYRTLKTQGQVDRERGRPTPMVRAAAPAAAVALEGQLLGWFWDDIVDFATDVYNGATKIVISIAEQVEIAIHKVVDTVTNIVHVVVSTVEDALNAVAGFFEQLAIGIGKLIEFLRVLFDWQAILATHRILHEMFLAIFDITTHSLSNTRPFTDAVAALAGLPAPPVPSGMESLNTTRQGVRDTSPASAQANSVEGKSMVQRSGTQARSTSYTGPAAPDPTPAAPGSPMEALAREIPALFSDVLDLSLPDLAQRLESIARKVVGAGLVAAGQAAAAIMGQLADVVKWTVKVLDARIDIPFISELYKWITGSDLTILDVICLALAVPVNLAYAVVTLLQGQARRFADDAGDIAGALRAAAGLGPRVKAVIPGTAANGDAVAAAPSPVAAVNAAAPVPDTPQDMEVALVVFRSITAVFDSVADLTFAEIMLDQAPLAEDVQNTLSYWQGLGGIISLSLQTFGSQKNFEARLRAVAGPEAAGFLPPYPEIVYTLYGIQMALRVVKMRGAVASMIGLNMSGSSGFRDLKDKIDYPITVLVGVAAVSLIPIMIKELGAKKQKLDTYGNSRVADEFLLLGIRDIVTTVPVLFEWMYTKQGVREIKMLAPGSEKTIYHGVYIVRHLCNVTGIVLHSVAVFKYGD